MQDNDQEQGLYPQVADPFYGLRFWCGGFGCNRLFQGEKFELNILNQISQTDAISTNKKKTAAT